MSNRGVKAWLSLLEKQRRALRMTLPVVAQRAKLSRATVYRILREKSASASLANIDRIAMVLGAELVLRLQEPDLLAEREIQAQARRIVQMVQGTMALEAQGIEDQGQLNHLLEVAAAEIRAKPRKQLWGKPTRRNRSSPQSQAKLPSPTSPS